MTECRRALLCTAFQGGLVGGGSLLVALARAVWIHWADALRMGAFLVRGAVLEVLDDRLEGHGL